MSEAIAITPTLRQRLRAARGWIVTAAIVLVIGVMTLLFTRPPAGEEPKQFGPENPGPDGTRAVVEVLKQQGINVTTTASVTETTQAVTDPASTTILVSDQNGHPSQERLRELSALGVAHIVLLAPGYSHLTALGGGIEMAKSPASPAPQAQPLPAGDACADPLRENAPQISELGGARYRLPGGAANDTSGVEQGVSCYGSQQDGYALVSHRVGETRITALGADSNLTNGLVLLDSNAALALGTLGDHKHLVWYLSSDKDLIGDEFKDSAMGPGAADATPRWMTAATLLAMCVAIAVMLRSGRRFGPLVSEALPVTVPAAETVLGRARLYDRSGARLRALDNIRIGAIRRMAVNLGLPRTAPAPEVSDAVAALLGADQQHTREVLLGTVPASDTELVALSDHVLRLERAVQERARPTLQPQSAALDPNDPEETT